MTHVTAKTASPETVAYYNGVMLFHCFEADDMKGYAKVYAKDAAGRFILDADSGFARTEVRGDVSIRQVSTVRSGEILGVYQQAILDGERRRVPADSAFRDDEELVTAYRQGYDLGRRALTYVRADTVCAGPIARLDHRNARVYLNGKMMPGVIEADAVEGFIRRMPNETFETNQGQSILRMTASYNEAQAERAYGIVEIEYPKA